MSWSGAYGEIKAALEGVGLSYTPGALDEDLLDANVGAGRFDGSFRIVQEGDPRPLRELVPKSGPVVWTSNVRILIGTEIKAALSTDGTTAENRAREVLGALLFPSSNFSHVWRVRRSRATARSRKDRRLQSDMSFDVSYTGA